MTDEELTNAFAALRPTVTNVFGFHELAESGNATSLQQAQYDAYVYAGGVQLAMQVMDIVNALEDREED